jgi:hypothetical protein
VFFSGWYFRGDLPKRSLAASPNTHPRLGVNFHMYVWFQKHSALKPLTHQATRTTGLRMAAFHQRGRASPAWLLSRQVC